MKKRLLTGIFIILALAATLFLRSVSPFIADAVIVALSTIACLEVSKAFNKGLRPCNILITAIYPILLYVGFFIGIMNEVVFYYYIIYYLVVALVCLLFNFLMPFFFRKETFTYLKGNSMLRCCLERYFAWCAGQSLIIVDKFEIKCYFRLFFVKKRVYFCNDFRAFSEC